MKEKTLLRLALVCGIVGIAVLFCASTLMKGFDIENVDVEEQDSAVRLVGTIQSLKSINSTTFLTVKSEAYSSIVMFKTNNVPLRNGDIIEIVGKIDKNKDRTQLIADEIRLLG